MREWADILNDWKCGGEPEPYRFKVAIGERYEVYWCGTLEEVITVTEDNKQWIEDEINDPENDIREFRQI